MHPSSRLPPSAPRRFLSERTCWYPPLSLSVHVHGHMVDPPPIGSCRQKTAIHKPIHSSCLRHRLLCHNTEGGREGGARVIAREKRDYFINVL